MKVGLIFTGQGFQRIGMYRDLYDKYEEFRETFEEANGVLSYKLQEICFQQTFMTRIETKLEHISEKAGHFFEETQDPSDHLHATHHLCRGYRLL